MLCKNALSSQLALGRSLGMPAVGVTLLGCLRLSFSFRLSAMTLDGVFTGGHMPDMQIGTFESMYPHMAPDGGGPNLSSLLRSRGFTCARRAQV